MRLIVCVDDCGSMSFGGRRQSRDRRLRDRILELTAQDKLWMDTYSAELFKDAAEGICVSDDCLALAGENEWCFAEVQDLTPYVSRIDRLVIYRWNRLYPADRKLPDSALQQCPHLVCSRNFAGSSHETITEEVYSR